MKTTEINLDGYFKPNEGMEKSLFSKLIFAQLQDGFCLTLPIGTPDGLSFGQGFFIRVSHLNELDIIRLDQLLAKSGKHDLIDLLTEEQKEELIKRIIRYCIEKANSTVHAEHNIESLKGKKLSIIDKVRLIRGELSGELLGNTEKHSLVREMPSMYLEEVLDSMKLQMVIVSAQQSIAEAFDTPMKLDVERGEF